MHSEPSTYDRAGGRRSRASAPPTSAPARTAFTLSLFAALAITLALGFSGCTDNSTPVVNVNSAELPGIAISGRGEVEAPPDTGFLTLGVRVTATTVADARDRAASSAEAVISSVKRNGVAARDIQTTQLSISPEFDYRNGSPRITGYTVVNTVSVTVRKLDSFSKVVDDAVAAGRDTVILQGVGFRLDDTEKAIEQAREQAMADAKTKAEQMAKLGGVKLGKPLQISEGSSAEPPPVLLDRAAEGSGKQTVPTPIEAGTSTVTVTVQVRYAIEQ